LVVAAVRRASVVAAAIAITLVFACKRSPSPSGEGGAPSGSTSTVASVSTIASSSSSATVAGAALVVNDCLACHARELLEQQRLTPEQWKKVVDKMHGWGAPADDDKELANLVSYLASEYGPDAGAYTMPTLGSDEATNELAPTPDGPYANGDAGRGATLYRDQCASCHGADGKGAQMGITLVDRPLLWRAEDFARNVRVGRGRMPSFAATTDGQLADLLAFLRAAK
jgi:mono/diheme cytochrome c family protein